MGIGGGRPNSSFLFVGYTTSQPDVDGSKEGEDLLVYLDPHHSRPHLPQRERLAPQDLDTFACRVPRYMSMRALDPSLVLGFYVRDDADFLDFLAWCTSVGCVVWCGGCACFSSLLCA